MRSRSTYLEMHIRIHKTLVVILLSKCICLSEELGDVRVCEALDTVNISSD